MLEVISLERPTRHAGPLPSARSLSDLVHTLQKKDRHSRRLTRFRHDKTLLIHVVFFDLRIRLIAEETKLQNILDVF